MKGWRKHSLQPARAARLLADLTVMSSSAIILAEFWNDRNGMTRRVVAEHENGWKTVLAIAADGTGEVSYSLHVEFEREAA